MQTFIYIFFYKYRHTVLFIVLMIMVSVYLWRASFSTKFIYITSHAIKYFSTLPVFLYVCVCVCQFLSRAVVQDFRLVPIFLLLKTMLWWGIFLAKTVFTFRITFSKEVLQTPSDLSWGFGCILKSLSQDWVYRRWDVWGRS